MAGGSLPGRGGSESHLEQLHGRQTGHGGPGREAVLRPGQGLQGGPVVRLEGWGAQSVLPGEGGRGDQDQADSQLQCWRRETVSSAPGVQTSISSHSVQVQVRAERPSQSGVILSLIC